MSPLSTSTDMPVRSSRQTKSAPQPQQKSASISMPTRFNSTASKDSRSAARSRRSPRGGSHRVHNNVERQYRARLNDQYSVLLDALPVEITSSHGTDGDKTLSKIEILDLAKQHIATLEEEEAQLKEEKVMLKGQMQLLKGLVQLTGELVP
ncbi:uncharacterized protein LY89DRAFT_433299 [Mollisia scopiformis]|uniref:BHLH domain-containing protein n=1 Tax=Mollisia scopiformis TaxID=149040 RepID=A0A194XMW1_MOLSC|nr:uncharacterized protein LY89DRAFT_433299 [Mollisia scopiformis]KUJ21424.1 hypothetical protein LY89DRAFT_433299 [Mollisia scopiformis]